MKHVGIYFSTACSQCMCKFVINCQPWDFLHQPLSRDWIWSCLRNPILASWPHRLCLNADLPVFLCRYLSHLIALYSGNLWWWTERFRIEYLLDLRKNKWQCPGFRMAPQVAIHTLKHRAQSRLFALWVVFWRMLKVEHMNRMRRSWRRMSDGLIIINIVDSMLPEAVWSFWSWKSYIILHCFPLLACYASIQLIIFAAQTDSDLLSLPW